MTKDDVAYDFPTPAQAGCVAGSHPKLVVEERAGQYRDHARRMLHERHAICQDLLRQLVTYTENKLASQSRMTKAMLLDKVISKLEEKRFGWGLSLPEMDWIALHLRKHFFDPGDMPS